MNDLRNLKKKEIKEELKTVTENEPMTFVENYGSCEHVNHILRKYSENDFGIRSHGNGWMDQIEERWNFKQAVNFLFKNSVVLL